MIWSHSIEVEEAEDAGHPEVGGVGAQELMEPRQVGGAHLGEEGVGFSRRVPPLRSQVDRRGRAPAASPGARSRAGPGQGSPPPPDGLSITTTTTMVITTTTTTSTVFTTNLAKLGLDRHTCPESQAGRHYTEYSFMETLHELKRCTVECLSS